MTNINLSNYEFIVLALDHYNTLGLIRSLGESGIKPIYIAIKNKYKIASYSRYIKELHEVSSIQEGYEYLINTYTPKDKSKSVFVYTIDDKTQSYLDKNYRELNSRGFVTFNAMTPGAVSAFMDKWVILQYAEQAGLKVPKTVLVNKGEVPEDLIYPIITKSRSPVNASWKADVHVCNNKEELIKAYEYIQSPTVLLQQYIKKTNESCSCGFSINNGKDIILTTESNYKYLIPGYYSPYMSVKTFNEEEFPVDYAKIQKLFKTLKYEGLFDIEFIIDKNGEYYFMEINFRHSAWGYSSTKNKMNLPVEWAYSMILGQITLEKSEISEGYTAMVEPFDYKMRVIEKRCSFFKWLHDFLHANCKFYWNWKDLKPSLHMLFHNKIFR